MGLGGQVHWRVNGAPLDRRSTTVDHQRTRSGLNRGNGIREKRATIHLMVVAIFFLRVLEVMFFVGLAGSSVVVLISFIEDGKELFGKDEE
jgi:hypothetical protein